ncbi:ATP-dependent DNA helicase PcrA [Candidatus Campbellbacteria bacterium]|nr:MAG: ATP-dependent DNA helicase PcrA [Candidatus Campbellbacteria bacterium]
MKISLNKQQQKAVAATKGPVLVLATAGSGKTMTLTARIVNLINKGVLPQNILAITFTNKAAGEMKQRIQKAILKNAKTNFKITEQGFEPFVSTFHSLGLFIIKENYQKLGISKYFSIYDKQDTTRAVKEAIKNLNLDSADFEIKNIVSYISKNKSKMLTIQNFNTEFIQSAFAENLFKIWQEYEKIKTEDGAYDFDDLILIPTLLLQKNKEIQKHYQNKWQYIHIDEYQDTNKVQNKLISLLVNPETENIFAVGDDDQSIYAWRGSDIENILSFEKKYKNVLKIFMEQNYRSTKNITQAADFIIQQNQNRYPKSLFSQNQEGEKIHLHNAFSEKQEAEFVAQEIKEKLKNKNITENDIAVLYRANFQSRILEEAMLKHSIPYQVIGTKFFNRAEVKDIISYIQAALNPNSLVDLKRVINNPKRGIGPASVVKIFAANDKENIDLPKKAKENYKEFLGILKEIKEQSTKLNISDLIEFTIKKSGFQKTFEEKNTDDDQERLANMYELALFAKKYSGLENEVSTIQFLEDVALMSDADTKKDEEKKPTVKLMTIHASKGLEFKTVFVTGAEDILFSPQADLDQKEYQKKLDEERRLFFVAATRAKEFLYITWCSTRSVYGRTETNLVCPFVLDIPEKLLEYSSTFNVDVSDNDDEDIVYLEW